VPIATEVFTDHPLDPKNKLLFPSFVESPDVKNLYDGIATLDKNAAAVIQLPLYSTRSIRHRAIR
jgi:hypothetical protein